MNPQDQPSDPSREGHEFQPGRTVTPNPAGSDPSMPSLPSPVAPAAPTPPAAVAPQAPAPAALAPQEPIQSLFRPTDDPPEADEATTPTPVDLQMQDNGREITWTAAEFIEHHKSPAWFLALIAGAVVIVGVAYLITRDWLSTGFVAAAVVIFGIAAARPPRILEYSVSNHGVRVGNRAFPFDSFRSFSIVAEDAASSIVLMPLKRFMPPISLYYDPADEEAIGDLLATHLPYEQHEHELTERLMRRIRF